MAAFVPNSTNIEWIRPYLTFLSSEQQSTAKIYLEEFPGAGGLNASTKILKVESNEKTFSFIYKETSLSETAKNRSKELGLPRESNFYENFGKDASFSMPKALFAYGNMETGDKTLILENLGVNGIQSGYFFGPGSPLNWGKNLDEILAAKVPEKLLKRLDAVEVARKAFTEMARFHRQYWCNKDLLQFSWLKGVSWHKGEDEQGFTLSQNTAKNYWNQTKAKIEKNESTVRWDDNLVKCIDASIAKVSFSDYVSELQSRPFTFVHGDFHPANVMFSWNEVLGDNGEVDYEAKSILVDYEVIGIGSGPQDLAQYLISHMTPSLRREHERSLVELYYQTLVNANHDPTNSVDSTVNSENYSFEECWTDYKEGGLRRWIWLMALLTGMCPDVMNQYFADQVSAFLNDHGFTPEIIKMPRV